MRVEREIAEFAIPFTAGVLLAVCSADISYGHLISSCIIVTALALLGHGRRLSDTARRCLIGAVAFGCGILCGATGVILHMDMPESAIERIALKFCSRIQSAIDDIPFRDSSTSALTKALLTGERASLPREVTEAFRDSGASHILSLSGLHLGIIYGIFSKGLSISGNSIRARRIRSMLIIFICGFYTLATGAGASIVRAFLFILIGETARLTGRYHGTGHTLLTALVVQLVIIPLDIKSVSFQLSYAAMAGIAFIYPWLRDFWPDSRSEKASTTAGRMFIAAMRWIWNSAALSIACQVTTGPLAYMYFGTFPMNFLLTNLLSLPLTGIIIPCTLVTLILSVLGWCPQAVTDTTEAFVRLLIRILEVISSM